jgi:hypothetical protein
MGRGVYRAALAFWEGVADDPEGGGGQAPGSAAAAVQTASST